MIVCFRSSLYPRYMKTFTLDEALALLPVISSLLDRATESRSEAAAVEADLQEINRRIFLSGGMRIDVGEIASKRTTLTTHMERMKQLLSEINEIGAQVKDLDQGLIDFPAKLDNEIVLLCWKRGEQTIQFWHSTDSGFAGRQPIDDRFMKKTNTHLN